MADLSSQDVQRIVNDAAGQIRGNLMDLRQQIDQVSRETDDVQRIRQQFEDVQRRVMEMERLLQQVAGQLQQINQAVAGNQRADQVTDIMAQQIGELKTRFQAVERFAQDMSDYMQAQRARQQEDEGYRSVSG